MVLHRSVALTRLGYILAVFNYELQLIKAHLVYFLRLVDLMIIICSITDIGNDVFGEPVEFLSRTGEGSNLVPCFSIVGPRPGTGPWHQLYRAARV
jgi:hypothetical protein